MFAARRYRGSNGSSSSSSSSSSRPKTSFWSNVNPLPLLRDQRTSHASNKSKATGLFRRKRSTHTTQEHIPIDTVRKLLMGHIDPVELAQEILPHEDLAAVVRYNSAPFRPPLDLKNHCIVTSEDVLFVGLTYVGFEGKRQDVRPKMNIERFCSHYKLCPESILDAWNYFNEWGDNVLEFRRLLISLNFLKCYDTEHVLSGRWKLDEDTLRKHIWTTIRRIQSHREALIYFDPSEWPENQVHIMTIDTVSYPIEEQRADADKEKQHDSEEQRIYTISYPIEEQHADADKEEQHSEEQRTDADKVKLSSDEVKEKGGMERWFDHKTHSAGVKYEMGLPLCLKRQTCVWSRGPFPAGDKAVAHDGCLFRGGSLKQPKNEWDRDSLYFQLPNGKKAIGDSLYKGMPDKCTVSLNGHNKVARGLINRAKAREERYHGHTKEFNVLKLRFRHGSSPDDTLSKHKACVDSIHILLHFDLQHRPLFDFP